ncbi:hypothetical protein IC620_10775 [Hazenella sp. IB182357]|uniref:asparagine synthase (glutamine-hydrolyzing) n=1 Tax=Polycladospora coralii TaxID=2771432 RepID=A0A926RUV2_9BACL|nr:asparagine synthase-related protein [Polycladospora coralii]MBD1372839.1 hypothetical protein [Polycladospora coralii]
MYLGSFNGRSLSFETMYSSHLHIKEKKAECIFVGELLSTEEDVLHAVNKFITDQRVEHLLFLRGNYQSILLYNHQLWLLSDLGNVRPIYYTQRMDQILFSSHLTPIHEFVKSKINRSWLARSLKTGGFHIETETPFEKINMIPGGFGLHIKNQGNRLFQAWNIDNECYIPFNIAQEKLREELTSSVLLRCNEKKITSDLSGGLDSSTITWIASKKHPVHSITLIGKEEDEDCRIAKEIANQNQNIEQTILSPQEIPAIFTDMRRFYTDAPIPFLWSANKIKKKLIWAKKKRSDIHFNGEGGDTVLGADFAYLTDLLHQGKWKTFLTHSVGWARERAQSPWKWMHNAFYSAFSHSSKPKHLADWYTFSQSIPRMQYSKYLGQSCTLLGIHYLGYVSHGLKDLAIKENINLCVPYLDHNVLRICLKVRSEEKMNPNLFKPLLKKAFKEELPDCLLNRNTKGDYTADVYDGMKRNHQFFQNDFKSMYLSDLGLIDLYQFQEAIKRLELGVPVKLFYFQQTLALEMWLRKTKIF